MKSDYIVYGILVIVFGIVIYTIYTLTSSSVAIPVENKNINAAFATITSGDTETGNAQIDLTPTGFENGQFKFDVKVNTHSVELSQYDLARITTLEYDGKKIYPMSCPKLEGHHSSGIILFNVGQHLSKFKITIVGMPSEEERTFEWG